MTILAIDFGGTQVKSALVSEEFAIEKSLTTQSSPQTLDQANDVINHNKNPFDMWYDLKDEAGLYLDSNTKYYWQCYAIVNGKEYKVEIKSFTTLNSS